MKILKILIIILALLAFFTVFITIASIGIYLHKINIVVINNKTIESIYYFGVGVLSINGADYIRHKLISFYKTNKDE